jgi:hypothetical protein
MSTPTGPQRASSAALRRASWPDQGMRVSDADRADVADRLAKHYSDGRLDQAEFDERLDRAMRAKTRADLVVLLADLPEGEPLPPDDGSPPRNQRRQQRQILKAQLERERLMLSHERQELRRRRRELRWHTLGQLLVIIGLVVVMLAVVRLFRDIYSVWLIIAILAFLWLRSAHSRRGRDGGPGSSWPENSGPGSSWPGNAGPGSSAPGSSWPGNSGPGNAGPRDTGPGGAGPRDTGPGGAGPGDGGPQNSGL